MNEDLRLGIAGCGKITTEEHVPDLMRVPGVRLAAFFDLVESKCRHLRDTVAPEAALFSDFDEMLKSGLDAVLIATPNHLHCSMTLAALNAGLHVLCEKPMAGNVADATRIVAAARKARRVVHVNQSLRYSPPYAAVAELVSSGRIGRPLHVRCIRTFGGTPDKLWSPGATWFMSKQSQGGIIFDIGVHMADLLQWCAGPVDSVAAFLETRTEGVDVPDHLSAIFRFENGATGVLELSWTMPFGAGLLEIYGSAGRIRMVLADKSIELVTTENGVETTSHPEPLAGVPPADQAFVEAVLRKAPTRTPPELGRDAVALCAAIAKAGQTGRSVKVKRFGKRR